MRYISIAALAVSAPVIVFAFFLPNLRLPDKQNLVEGVDDSLDMSEGVNTHGKRI